MSDDKNAEGDRDDELLAFIRRSELVVNDAVAGETVEPGAGEGNNGPTGGAPREAEPTLDEHREHDDADDAPIDLRDKLSSGAPVPGRDSDGSREDIDTDRS